MTSGLALVAVCILWLGDDDSCRTGAVEIVRSARSGSWSDPSNWLGQRIPAAEDRVQIQQDHRVVYDIASDAPIRSIHVAGTLSFAPDRDTRLDVGLIKIQAGDDASEDGFNCDAHLAEPDPTKPRPALEVGAPERPIQSDKTALIRLGPRAGMDPTSTPAIVCCGGRMEFHGAPLSRTWLKLGEPASKGDETIRLAGPVTGWRVGDKVIITSTLRQMKRPKTWRPSVRDNTQTEERSIKSIDGDLLTLDRPLDHAHRCEETYRAEVADLSRNVVVESAEPDVARGHTMYHRDSAGSIGYAEFRHLGKRGVLGRYALHFHRAGDTMRGSSVIGASVWDSANRWITIHGTDYLVVRDCVGYKGVGHGFFLEDGTEAFNVLDRNLAVQALGGEPLPGQVLASDPNDGAGFWWANSLNSFTRNVAAECDSYGFRFDPPRPDGSDVVLSVRRPEGAKRPVDVRTLPFIRFEANEAHTQRAYGINLGGGAGGEAGGASGVGPDARHPFILRKSRVWDAQWAVELAPPSVLIDGMDIERAEYGLWRPIYDRHAYRLLTTARVRWPEYAPTGEAPEERDYPGVLAPLDDRPPLTIITHVLPIDDRRVRVRGTTVDDQVVRSVRVNDRDVQAIEANFAEWRIDLEAGDGATITALAEDAAGNVEPRPHRVRVGRR